MTEDRRETVRLDEAIDRAVRDLTAHEAPADLRARVLARLEQPAAAGAWWTPGRIAAAAAAVAVVAIATYLGWPSRTAPVAEPSAVVAEARPAAEPPGRTPAPEEAAPSEGTTPERGTRTAAATASPSESAARIIAAAAVVETEPYRFTTPRLVEPLEPPLVVAIEPLVESHLAIEPITVGRLSFEPVVIEPLGPDR